MKLKKSWYNEILFFSLGMIYSSHSWSKLFWKGQNEVRREEKPTRCHCMLYCTYDTLSMFRALLCPSSEARDYVCVITAYGVQCLVAGCRGSGAEQQA